METDRINEYKNFGAMVCCASNGVMKPEKVKELIDLLSVMGYNLLELCIDDIYKIDGEPYFGYLRGGYTKEEVREMDEYAKSKGIELVPCIQVLAHLVNLVKIPEYSDITDIDDILLIDEPKTYRLIDKMIKFVSDNFSSKKINLCFDEAHHVGLGKYLDKHGYKDRYELLLKHLNKVCEMVDGYGLEPHIWSDMFFRLANKGDYVGKGVVIPENVMKKIPENLGLCYWDYYSEDEETYDEMFRAHEAFKRELWFAGGAWCWSGFAPQNRMSLCRSKAAMKQVGKHGIKNVLITMWGDNGRDCSCFSVLPTLYAVRQYAIGNYDEESIKAGFEELFGVSFDDFMTLDIPNKNRSNPNLEKLDNSCKAMLYNDCFLGLRDYYFEKIDPVPYMEYAETLEQTGKRMGKYKYLFDNLAALCRVLDIKAGIGIKTRNAYKSGDKELLKRLVGDYREAADRLGVFRDTLRKVWMNDNKPYGWDIQEIRLGGLKARLYDCAQRIEEYLSGETKNIPELEETLLPYGNWNSGYNLYRGFISVSEL